MQTLEQQLVTYARYHRDRRNIATHFLGIPLIVFAVALLLYVPITQLSTLMLTPALFIAVILSIYYLCLDFRLGALMSLLLALSYTGAKSIYHSWPMDYVWYYIAGIALLLVGWVIQFIGHYYEGKKPAFLDDLRGLVTGPLFVVVELLFLMGLCKSLEQTIVSQAGEYR
ncbi:Mpo1 family 2-hydroxy fatty acid dioxygenase [Pseudoalteromonas sp. T1lg23B]|uniref:Mpo1 family 2-hydroxy fatty acid dioxygenase n=1 Tax=Pseudoalteromonas sp. T1lg23B TaxID=2077097 RepID=UPI000CF72CA7|nr:Mpo1-like protein [Pseudoalteromonas sp. T1lg23B]